MKKLVALTVFICCLPLAEGYGQSGGQNGYATQQLSNPPRTRLSSRIRKSMERHRKRGVYGEDLREMLARSSVDKSADGPLVRADRLRDPGQRLQAYEKILRDNVHPRNLKSQLNILNAIRRVSWKAKVGRTEMTDILKRYTRLQRQICEIEVSGYGNSVPEKRFAKQLRNARTCLAQACKALAEFNEPCPANQQTADKKKPPKKPRARVQQRHDEMVRRRDKPPQIDPDGGKLSGRELFYVVGVTRGRSLPLRAAPNDSARQSGQIRGGDKIALARRTSSERTVKGWEKVCGGPQTCGWVRQHFVTSDADLSESRRVIDYYLVSLVSSSLKGILDLTTGAAHSTFRRLHRKYPNGKVKDHATHAPTRWSGKCIACEKGLCQTLYDVQTKGRNGPDLVVFESRRGTDGKMRVATSRPYAGNVKRMFDSLHPYCWK